MLIPFIKKSLNEVKKYRHSDYGTLIIGSLIGIMVGLLVYVFHLVMMLAAEGVEYLITDNKFITKIDFIVLPIITMLGGLLIGILKFTVFKKEIH